MHLRGKDMTFSVTYPDGREEILLSVPQYSFNWQVIYAFDEPIKLPAGSMLRAVAHYDNSAKNKFNPAPDQELPWGGQSWHEMYFPYFDLAVTKEVDKAREEQGIRDVNVGHDGPRSPQTQRQVDSRRRTDLPCSEERAEPQGSALFFCFLNSQACSG